MGKQIILAVLLICCIMPDFSLAEEPDLPGITIMETAGLDREREYIRLTIQLETAGIQSQQWQIEAQEENGEERIPCQIITRPVDAENHTIMADIVFPVSIGRFQQKHYRLNQVDMLAYPATDLQLNGTGTELVIENTCYRADLTKRDAEEPQSHNSGQIRELLMKMGFDQLLTNAEDRLHWAPNFKRPGLEYYTTIAHWESPVLNIVENGPYTIRTIRQDRAPDHPEILLTAVYDFYAELPWFRFYSQMDVTEGLWLELLRNDEMTMDSMFTHLGFERPDGRIVDLAFSERYDVLNAEPIQNTCPWLCFYNIDKGYAFGSIRIRYDNSSVFGETSPTFQPHTQIGEWLGGITYWNRRLIHDHLMFVPKGSCYREENGYLVFKIGEMEPFETIRFWAERLHHPLKIDVVYP